MTAVFISCDEAGFTGPGLLDEHQPVFAYAAHDLSEVESRQIVEAVRQKYRLQSAEIVVRKLDVPDQACVGGLFVPVHFGKGEALCCGHSTNQCDGVPINIRTAFRSEAGQHWDAPLD